MTKYRIGGFFSSGGATLYKNPTDQICDFSDPFTQMIWHSTQHFGCGKARSRCGKVIAVAYYEPKGNIEGQFHENIFPPVKEHETGNGDFSESDENNETNYCDNNLIVILYINVINVIVLLILVIVVL